MKTIFLAEDDLFMVKIIKKVFDPKEFTIIDANDGEQAIAKLEDPALQPSVIILDVMMPKYNGFEVFKKLREIDRLKNIPVIMLTNFTSDEDIQTAQKLGAAAYLTKSQFEPKEIADEIMKVMK